MKAFLLAAGLGTRLKPLTDDTPKCLVKINGIPLLAWWIRLFEEHNVTDVLINLHYLPSKVKEFLDQYETRIRFNFFYEEKLLGSAGTMRENRAFVEGEKDFIVCYADNLTNYNLSEFYKFHLAKGNRASISLFKTDTPTSKGIVELDGSNTVVAFEEKPKMPKSDLANAGIYVFQQSIFDIIPENPFADIGFDVLPKLIGNMSGWITNDYLIDIGTIEHLVQAEKDWANIIKEKGNDF